jgi:CheY-like chemotaxis protein
MRSTHAARGDIAGDISVQSHAAEVIERLTVLLVGDNKPIRILLYDFLEGGGYNVLTAGNGEDALVVCREFRHPIALLQTDVEMAGMSGFELAEHASLLHPPWKVLGGVPSVVES